MHVDWMVIISMTLHRVTWKLATWIASHYRGQTYEGVSNSSRTDRLERELQMVQLWATRCICIAILWVSLMSFAAITLCVASQRVFVVYFVIDSVRKLLYIPSYAHEYITSLPYKIRNFYKMICLLWSCINFPAPSPSLEFFFFV
jgi:hypothetical protein